MKPLRNANGYTLIEALIGGLLIVIIVIAVFQVISQGSLYNKRDLLRRRAFQELEAVLEKPQYSYKSPFYMALATGSQQPNTVKLDSTGTNPLYATVNIRVDALTYTYNAVTIPAKRVTAIINYSSEGTAYAESLQTIITLADIN
jgi:Tfp pilus assembly protein PilV